MMGDISDKEHELRKQVHGLSHIERRKVYGGDKSIYYEKMGLLEEIDLERYRKKIGLSPEIDLTTLDPAQVDELVHLKKLGNPLKQAKKEFEVDEFKRMLVQFQKERHK